jgi:aspartyl-tRNA(Asn)/glutamyl-tRNA(Gln) amidotransferase subunit B
MKYTPIIGMEIHVELATLSKLFCGCKNDPFNAPEPNRYTCPTCLAMPGGLPVTNKKAVEWTIRLGLALGCEIPLFSQFDRKHYFYPDLPKGYQISQYDHPLCKNGLVRIPSGDVRINRVHLEEDAGKLLHQAVDGKNVTLIDFNRSGVPLVEIVTEPDIHSGDQAKAFLKKLHQIIRYLDISGADMEKGTMRLEPNISLIQTSKFKSQNFQLPEYKVEVKNINSFNFVKRAIEYEVKRQSELLDKGETPEQETRGYVEATSSTVSQRKKGNSNDYRYFPDPDIPPMKWEKSQITNIKSQIGELPDAKIERFQKEYGLSQSDCEQLTESKDRALYFENCVKLTKSEKEFSNILPKIISNMLINRSIDIQSIEPRTFLASIKKEKADNSVDSTLIEKTITAVISANPKAVIDYKAGKTPVLMFLVGQVKKELKGKGEAKMIENELLMQLS